MLNGDNWKKAAYAFRNDSTRRYANTLFSSYMYV